MILVHEVYGLTDWAEGMADELASKGFIVIAPDFLSGDGPHGGGFDDFPSEVNRVSAIQSLNPDVALEDLDAAVDYGQKCPSWNRGSALNIHRDNGVPETARRGLAGTD